MYHKYLQCQVQNAPYIQHPNISTIQHSDSAHILFSAGIVNSNHYLSQDWSTTHLRLRYLFSVVSLHTQHITVIFLPDCTYDHAFCQFAQNWRENMEKRASWHHYSTSGTCFLWSDQIPDVNADHDRITMFTCSIFCHSEWIQSKEVKLFSMNVRDFRFITRYR